MNISWSENFSYDYYKKILKTAKSNFELYLFSEAPEIIVHRGNKRKLFLRHDIDIDLARALEMAKIEYELNVKATYMVMLNSPTYDIEAEESKLIIRQMIDMGHEIGLHFDLDADRRTESISIDSVGHEIKLSLDQLEQIIERPVHSLSFHRPLPQFLNGPLKVADRINAYAIELMRWYLSDSAGRWREGEPLPKLIDPPGNLLQLLVHPIWWGTEHATASERLEDFFKTRTAGWSSESRQEFDKALSGHISVRRKDFNLKGIPDHLPTEGKFNTDAVALTNRIESHRQYGSGDLNQWIFEQLDIQKGSLLLDLGCGTGKQTIPASQMIGDNGRVVAFDKSQEALDLLQVEAKRLQIPDRIVTCHGDIDDLTSYIGKYHFDRALASYSLYYAKRPQIVLETLSKQMKPGGILFFCGPSKENNAELKNFQNSLSNVKPVPESNSAKFMEETGPALAGFYFSDVQVYSFQNSLRFDSSEALYRYWSSYNLYDENIDGEFKEAADKYFQSHSIFETVKRVVGIKAIR